MAPDLFLIGDSHAVAIGEAARRSGRAIAGGPLGSGRHLESPFYAIEAGAFRLTDPRMAALYRDAPPLLSFDGPILSTVGFNALRFARDLREHLDRAGASHWSDVLSAQAFRRAVLDSRRTALAFYRLLSDHGRRVFFVPSPQRAPAALLPFLRDFEEVLIPEIAATGAVPIDVRDRIRDPATGAARPDFARPEDQGHATPAYGLVVLEEFDRLVAASAPAGAVP